MQLEARQVCSVGAQLGEGPVWVGRDAALYFVDIKGRKIHRFDPASGALHAWATPDLCGFVVPVKGGGFVAGLKTGLHRFDSVSGRFELLATVEPNLPNNRLNDGALCPQGTLWFGSMDDTEKIVSGSLYHLTQAGDVMKMATDFAVPNGPAFSPDGRTFYHTDTANRTVYAFDRPSVDVIRNRRVFVRIEAGAGHPDGTAVDAEGCVWIALWGGWGVRRYSPSGELLATVRLPCSNVTKVAFEAEDGRTAYVTTAWDGLSATERESQPHAGNLFSFQAPAPGLRGPELEL